jgi:homogentisate 1,2-dioxygenase
MQDLNRPLAPNPYRWSAPKLSMENTGFFENLFHLASSGSNKHVFWYQVHVSMPQDYYADNDGELVFIPFQGKIRLQTEFGRLGCEPGQIVVIPRGICFKILAQNENCQGYMLENGGLPLRLPELGLIGANGLADPRHFYHPSAAFETLASSNKLYVKFEENIWEKRVNNSPLNIVAWQGNYLPYFYDTKMFNAINSVSYDHPDPSIFTLLSSDSDIPGIASLDLVLFPERLSVARHSFRLPYFHRNVMNEFMGLIKGQYEAKGEGFLPGGVSIHNTMTAHGPDYESWLRENNSDDNPIEIKNNIAFMFESNQIWQPTEKAMTSAEFQNDYSNSWSGFPKANLDKS